MKTILNTAIGCLLLLVVGFPIQSSSAQDKDLQRTPETQDNQNAGLNALADRIKNFGFLDVGKNVVKKLEDRDRKEDPFGMAMDPEEALPELKVEEVVEEEAEVVIRTSLQEALQKFQPSGFFPSRKEIIVGAQNIGVGDAVLIDYNGVLFNLVIEDVTKSEIVMKDTETGEVASVNLGFDDNLPVGMSLRRPEASAADKSREAKTMIPFTDRVVKVE